jgi:outer membrane protein TolC
VAQALHKNRRVENADTQVSILEHELAAEKTHRLPIFGTGVHGNFRLTSPPPNGNNSSLPDPSGGSSVLSDNQNRATAILGFGIRQPILQLYEIGIRIRLKRTQVESAEEQLRLEEQSVAARVKGDYYNILATQTALAGARESIRFLRELERTVSDRVQQQAALQVDLLDVRARLGLQQANEVTYLNTLAQQKEQLNYELGRDIRTPFQEEAVPETPLREPDVEALQATALRQRPEVRQGKLAVTTAVLNRQLAGAAYIPALTFGFTYLRPEGFTTLAPNYGTLGLVLAWEPWDWGRRRENIRAAALAIRQQETSLDDTEARVLIEVNTQVRNTRATQEQLRAARAAQDAARERVRVENSRYAERLSLLSTVLQAQTEFAAAITQYQTALSSYLTALAELARAIGEGTR